jgi:hypothetical protein
VKNTRTETVDVHEGTHVRRHCPIFFPLLFHSVDSYTEHQKVKDRNPRVEEENSRTIGLYQPVCESCSVSFGHTKNNIWLVHRTYVPKTYHSPLHLDLTSLLMRPFVSPKGAKRSIEHKGWVCSGGLEVCGHNVRSAGGDCRGKVTY